MQQWAEIRRRVLVEQVSQRQILRETEMHWKTLQITDKLTRRPLPARLRIRLNGTKTLVDTNANASGSYSINLKPGRYYVQVGYASRNRKYKFYGSWVTISNRNVSLSVPLQPDIVIK